MKTVNNWYVLTGAPSSGKTTIAKLLEKQGYEILYEIARIYIDEELKKGKTIRQLRENEAAFQRKILDLKIDYESKLNPKKITFLDRAIPDSVAYNSMLKIRDKKLDEVIKKTSYKKIFIFERLEFEQDYARTESKEEVEKLEKLIKKTYKNLPFPLVKVPKMTIEKRLKFILNNL